MFNEEDRESMLFSLTGFCLTGLLANPNFLETISGDPTVLAAQKIAMVQNAINLSRNALQQLEQQGFIHFESAE